MKLILNVDDKEEVARSQDQTDKDMAAFSLLYRIHRSKSTIWYLNQLMAPFKPHYCWKWKSLSVMSCTKSTEDAGRDFLESGWWKQTLSSFHHDWKCKVSRVWSSELGALMRSHGEFQECCLICFAETWQWFWCSKCSFPCSSLPGQRHAPSDNHRQNWGKKS